MRVNATTELREGIVVTTAVQMQWLDVPFNKHEVVRASTLTAEAFEMLAHQGIVHIPLHSWRIRGKEGFIACLMDRIRRERSALSTSDLRSLAQQVRTHKNADEIYYLTLEGVCCADVIDQFVGSLRLPALVDPEFPYVIANRGSGWGQPLMSWDELAEQVRNLPDHPSDKFVIIREIRLGTDHESALGRMAQFAAKGPASFIVELVDDERAQLISRVPDRSGKQLRPGTSVVIRGASSEADLWGPEQVVKFVRGWLVQGLKPSEPDYHLQTVWEA